MARATRPGHRGGGRAEYPPAAVPLQHGLLLRGRGRRVQARRRRVAAASLPVTASSPPRRHYVAAGSLTRPCPPTDAAHRIDFGRHDWPMLEYYPVWDYTVDDPYVDLSLHLFNKVSDANSL